jgi:serine/threonine-protein kinase HipA
MTSEKDAPYSEAYVWIWLPGAIEPVVAGLLSQQGGALVFNYGRSYLARPDAIAIYAPELPLRPGALALLPGLNMPSCIRDASPDAWGRRVLINRKLGMKGGDAALAELDELTYLLDSGSDRIGALDFQQSAMQYIPRHTQQPTLEVELTRFRGHLTVIAGGVHDGREDGPVYAGVQAADGGVGPVRSHARFALERVWRIGDDDRRLGQAGCA